ncbi:E3 ubiquitin-protein ligase UBR2 [Ixodes scapularis]
MEEEGGVRRAGEEEDVRSPFGSELEATVCGWRKAHACGALGPATLRQFWARHVPPLLSPPYQCRPLSLAYDEAALKHTLLDSLERFVCGTSDPRGYFEELRRLESPPTLCGRVFKSGEPTYSCRDCGLDPTCVLCVDCFKSSAHKNHKYKMSMSCGGGYCDCGDLEAWKEFPFCQTHGRSSAKQGGAEEDPLERLPPDLVSRVELVLRAVLLYCHQMLTWNKSTELPPDLAPGVQQDTFVTMLFNDEAHTYEQVIQTLNRAIECTHREAIEYATTVDREGRSLVRSSSFADCLQVKQHIERFTSRHGSRPLRVLVMHSSVVAHQTFAMRLLSWLQGFLSQCQAFRLVFSGVMLEPTPEEGFPLVRCVMRADTQLWKTARAAFHQLFIGGMLMDGRCKRDFAVAFTRDYPDLLKEFVADDHEHPVSVTSLSVQIFTVPTLAHLLVAEENALAVLLRTFLSECEKHRNAQGRLAFERNQANVSFRRAQYVLYDLRYLLAVPPDVWTERLRKGFLYGVGSLLTLLTWMQGMDSVLRQVGQHVEFEAEWETGINIQLKLAPVVGLALEWCSRDREVAVKALRKALRALEGAQGPMAAVGRELAGHSASCVDYDVAALPVSIHLPLSRFVAGLLLCLDRFGLGYDSHEFQFRGKPTPEQLMELPLRTQVMVAQFRAGMWRRNGYSLLNQIYFYHNVRLRGETYDRDVTLLQAAAALLESNEFLIQLLHKYGLLAWAKDGYDSADEANLPLTVALAEEFLGLVLTLVSERSLPGVGAVTEADRLQREIVQLLCVEPLPHSQLVKLLPRGGSPAREAQVEQILARVAHFRRERGADPAATASTSRYELRPEFYGEFNPFFYHYTREEQSRAEEAQLRRRKQAGLEPCCPPPCPPEFARPFATVVNLLQCDVMLGVLNLVLGRASSPGCPSFSETQLEKALHLVGVALHEEQRLRDRGVPPADSFFAFTAAATRSGLADALERCAAAPRVRSQKPLLDHTLRHFRRVRDGPTDQCPMEVEEEADPGGRLAGARNAEAAAARRARIMAQMSAMQKNFIQEYSDLFKEAGELDVAAAEAPSASRHTCILCREDEELSVGGRTLVLSAFVQRSTVLSKDRSRVPPTGEDEEGRQEEVVPVPADLRYGAHTSTCGHVMHSRCWQKFFESVLTKERRRPARYGRHISFNVEKREFLCPLCECLSNTVVPLLPPVCALVPPRCLERAAQVQARGRDDACFEAWLEGARAALQGAGLQQTAVQGAPVVTTEGPSSDDKPLPRLAGPSLREVCEALPAEAAEHLCQLYACYEEPQGPAAIEFSASLVEMLKLFSQACYTVGLDAHPNAEDDRVPAQVWWSCAYTIHGTEWLLRGRPLLGDLSSRRLHCLEALVRTAVASLRVCSGEALHSHCLRLLGHAFPAPGTASCVLDVDAFGLLVGLCLSAPSLFSSGMPLPLGGALDAHVLRLVLCLHLVQVVLTVEVPQEDGMDTEPSQEDPGLLRFCTEVLQAAGKSTAQVDGRFLEAVRGGLRPFLRCSTILLHFLSSRPAPEALCQAGGDTWDALCSFLSLDPRLALVVGHPALARLATTWVSQPALRARLSGPCLVRHPMSPNALVALPADFSELINEASLFRCPNSDGDDSRSPTLCLVCGRLLCSQSYCCQVEVGGERLGACNLHLTSCGAGVGLFLRVRDCKVLLLVGHTKGCYLPPPYVDEYGETDPGLVRGNPLHLCPRRYDQLLRLWLSHGIPEQVAHALEQSTGLSSTNWALM